MERLKYICKSTRFNSKNIIHLILLEKKYHIYLKNILAIKFAKIFTDSDSDSD